MALGLGRDDHASGADASAARPTSQRRLRRLPTDVPAAYTADPSTLAAAPAKMEPKQGSPVLPQDKAAASPSSPLAAHRARPTADSSGYHISIPFPARTTAASLEQLRAWQGRHAEELFRLDRQVQCRWAAGASTASVLRGCSRGNACHQASPSLRHGGAGGHLGD